MSKDQHNTKKIIEQLKQEVRRNYSPAKCGWTSQRSMGNYDDCFNDGIKCGESYVWYQVGCILGMNLPEPIEPDDVDCDY